MKYRMKPTTLPSSLPSAGLSIIWRALGLDLFPKLLNYGLPFLCPRPRGERKKIVLRQNRWAAGARCMIHILPTFASLAIVALNLRGYYVGDELAGPSGQDSQKLGALQFAAKLHELAINASIAAMLFSYLRYELTLGKGLPLGAMFAGTQFKDLGFLWSIELWGAVFSRGAPHAWVRKTTMAAVLILAALLAAVAAPASAIALIPRPGLWPACGTRYWLNSSSDALWPTEVNASHFDTVQYPQAGDGLTFGHPAGRFQSIKDFSTALRGRGIDFVPARSLTVYGRYAPRTMNVTLKLGRNPDYVTTAFVPPLAVSEAFVKASTWWPSAAGCAFRRARTSGPRFVLARHWVVESNVVAPVTRVQCSSLMQTTGGQGQSIQFPLFVPWEGKLVSTAYTDEQMWKDAAKDNSTGRGMTMVYWSPLPDADFGNSTMGAIVVLPFEPNTSAITYTTCNIDAGWAPSRIWTFDSTNTVGFPSEVPDKFRGLGRYDVDWSWPRISVDTEWAKYLSSSRSQANETIDVFAAIATSAGVNSTLDPSHPSAIESILSMMFTDGLARTRSDATLQGQLKQPKTVCWERGAWADEYMQFGDAYAIEPTPNVQWYSSRLSVSVVGYAYSSDGATSKVACAILLLHVLLALLHTTYSLTSGLSSSSWDSVAEITVLAMNSTPSDALRNTCAGIELLSTMGLPVKIVESEKAGEHVEIVVETTHDEGSGDVELLHGRKVKHRSVKMNKEYGCCGG